MTAKILKALKGSISKWMKIAQGTGVDLGDRNCPLCQQFFGCEEGLSCGGCPVREKTGLVYCKRTPYTKWTKHVDNCGICGNRGDRSKGIRARCDDAVMLALKEVNFLESLLPKGKP